MWFSPFYITFEKQPHINVIKITAFKKKISTKVKCETYRTVRTIIDRPLQERDIFTQIWL